MGFNTTVFIINDGLGEIERYPEDFVQGIMRAMQAGGTVPIGHHANPVDVMPTAHADVPRLYGSHGNLMLELSRYASRTLTLARRDDYGRQVVEEYIRTAEHELKALKKALEQGTLP